MPPEILKRFSCLENGCQAVFEAASEDQLVRAVQKHVADAHDSFELEDFIIAGAEEVRADDHVARP